MLRRLLNTLFICAFCAHRAWSYWVSNSRYIAQSRLRNLCMKASRSNSFKKIMTHGLATKITDKKLQESIFNLEEEVDNQLFRSTVRLLSSGEIYFLETDDHNIKRVRGTWNQAKDSILKMIVERTFHGKSFEFTIKSHYAGTIRIDKNKYVAVGGEVVDDECDIDGRYFGRFSLVCNPVAFAYEMETQPTSLSSGESLVQVSRSYVKIS